MSKHNARKHKVKNKRWKKIIFRSFLTLFFLGCVAVLAGCGLFWYYAKDAPKLEDSKLEDTLSSKIYDVNGKLIMELGEKKRETISANEIPQQLKDAIISIEDKRFYKHMGVDPIRIAGAALSNVKTHGLQGGSTLTQQLIKLSYFSTHKEDQTIKRKAQEAWLAIQLEQKKSKDEILMYYINKVFMSNGLYGMETASEYYYGKKLKDLSLPQTALMAGMPQAPIEYDPTVKTAKNQRLSKQRRDIVLKEMYKDKKITKTEYDKAVATPITEGLIEHTQVSQTKKVIDNYLKEVIKETEKKTKKNGYTDGMDIYTNLNLDLQNYLYQLVNTDDLVTFPSDHFQTAITVMDPKNGHVLAQIGSRKVPDNVQLGENLATSAKRDVGSTVKPITDYAPAIEYLNFSTATQVLDAPYNYEGTKIPVNNYDFAYKGYMSIRNALVDSRNIPAVKTLMAVGLDKSEAFLKKLGVTYDTGFHKSSAIQGNMSSLTLTAAYVPFSNGGTYYKPSYVKRVVYPDGSEDSFDPVGTRVMKDSTAYMITDILKDVILRGTGTNAQIPGLPQAGKTGTSNYDDPSKVIGDPYGSPDSSFVGYTTKYTIGIWTGNKNFWESLSGSDQMIATTLYRNIMTYLTQNTETPDWKQPDSVIRSGSELYVKGHTEPQGIWNESDANYNGNYNNNNNSNSQTTPPASSNNTPANNVTPPSSRHEDVEVTDEIDEYVEEPDDDDDKGTDKEPPANSSSDQSSPPSSSTEQQAPPSSSKDAGGN